jgi:hypothetical protein
MGNIDLRRMVCRAASVLLLALSANAALAQTGDWEVWNEKWPVNVPITPSNSVVVYLQSNYGKLGEYAADGLKYLLNSPSAQAKVSTRALNYLKNIYNDPTVLVDEKARRFIELIEADIGPYVSSPVGPLNMKVGFAGSVDVMRLSWDRKTERLACQRSVCACPDGSPRQPGQFCYWEDRIGNQIIQHSEPARCTLSTDIVDVEAAYQVFRNGKLLAVYGEQRTLANGSSQGGSFSIPGISISLNATLPPSAFDGSGSAGPFYDYDPYNRVVGDPLGYTVTAKTNGCGFGYNNEYTGLINVSSGSTVDINGDGRPDFYPADVLAEKRNVGPFLGTKVSEHTDSSGKVTVAVFERTALTARSRFDDFSVAVPSDYVVIGGGAEGLELPVGHLLTASYPSDDLTEWRISTKDHVIGAPAKPKAWAIGLKLAGLTRQQVRDNIVMTSVSASPAHLQNLGTNMAFDAALISGGFKVTWTGAGSLGVASYPDGQLWHGASKDHQIGDPSALSVIAIGIRRNIPGFGTLSTSVRQATSTVASHPSASVAVQEGYALAGCGARVNWSGAGNLLWKIKPLGLPTQRSCEVASKDHNAASPATIDAFAVGLTAN